MFARHHGLDHIFQKANIWIDRSNSVSDSNDLSSFIASDGIWYKNEMQ